MNPPLMLFINFNVIWQILLFSVIHFLFACILRTLRKFWSIAEFGWVAQQHKLNCVLISRASYLTQVINLNHLSSKFLLTSTITEMKLSHKSKQLKSFC